MEKRVEDMTREELISEGAAMAPNQCLHGIHGDEGGNSYCPKIKSLEDDARHLATLLDEMICHITFDEWDRLHVELAKEGWKKENGYLKDLRDRYADRYRNV